MPDTYSLTVINDSELPDPTFAVFATLPVSSDFASLSLAWLTQQINATNQYVFTWEITWGFAWSASGTTPGYQWAGSGTLAADPNSTTESKAEFAYNGDFQLTPATSTPTGDTLWITDSPTVPLPSKQPSSVGVTLGGSPASVTNAGPNLYQTFTLHPTYYIDAGNYVKGQMVDGDSVTQLQELTFAGGSTALTATLSADNTWTVGNSSDVNFADVLDERAESDDDGPRYNCYSGRNCTGKILNHKDRHNCKLSGGKSWQDKDGTCYPV